MPDPSGKAPARRQAALRRGGWNRDSVKEGDQITVKGIMAKVEAGLSATTGNAQEVTMANGKRVLAGQADNEK